MRFLSILFGSCVVAFILFASGPYGWIVGAGILFAVIIYGIVLLHDIKELLSNKRYHRDLVEENRKLLEESENKV